MLLIKFIGTSCERLILWWSVNIGSDSTKPLPEPMLTQIYVPISDIGKSTGPRSLTNENSGGPMKTLIVPVLLSGKKFLQEPLYGDSYVEKIILGPVKVLGDQ